MANAGKILIMPKGYYRTDIAYEVLDMVNHNKATWVAKKTVIGIEPSDANSEYWFRMLGYGIANDLTTTEEGLVLDARQGKALMDEINASNSEIEKVNGDLVTERSERLAEIAVERERINQLTKMEEGSTTGDAELIDIRVGDRKSVV